MADDVTGEQAQTVGIECPRCGCRHLYVLTPTRAKRILRVGSAATAAKIRLTTGFGTSV